MAEAAGRRVSARRRTPSQVRGQRSGAARPAPAQLRRGPSTRVRGGFRVAGATIHQSSPAPAAPQPASFHRGSFVARAFLSGLRGRLLLLVVLAVLPAFGFSLYANWRDRQHQLSAVVDATLRLARVVASDQQRIIDGTREMLSELAEAPE